MPFEAAVEALAALLGDRLSRSEAERRLHGQNETWFPETPPDAVAWPISTEEVSKILAICHAYRMPVVAWGTGTSLEGHALAAKGGLSLDMGRMDKVLEVRPEDMLAVV